MIYVPPRTKKEIVPQKWRFKTLKSTYSSRNGKVVEIMSTEKRQVFQMDSNKSVVRLMRNGTIF